MPKHILKLAAALALAFAFAACSSDDEPKRGVPADACYDFVTLASIGPGESEFTLQIDGDSPLITYTSPYVFNNDNDAKLVNGQRVIILYTRVSGAPYTSGPINLYGYRVLDNKHQGIAIDAAIESDPVQMTSITRTGRYVNMQLQLSCAQAARPEELALCCQEGGLDAEYPELVLRYTAKSPGQNYCAGYASYDIGDAWDSPAAKGVVIRYLTADGWQSKTFNKQPNN